MGVNLLYKNRLGNWIGRETWRFAKEYGRGGGSEVILCMRSAALGGIEKLFVHIRVVKQKLTLGNWAGH